MTFAIYGRPHSLASANILVYAWTPPACFCETDSVDGFKQAYVANIKTIIIYLETISWL